MIEGVSSSTLVTLSDLVTIQAGYPFRGAIRDIPSGSVKAVQAKDISELGELIYSDLIVTDLTGKREPDWLKKGDILFSAKGAKHIASYVDGDLENTTCAPNLFLLHLKSKWQGLVNTQFLTWQLNQTPAQQYFKRSAEGSFQISIRKPVLAATPIALPSIETQNTIAKLYAASIKENALLHKLINNRQQQLNAIATDLMNSSNN
ncbi:restriction endonuclease subunit S [Providencia alcalifaciens]|jgi:restriction endonuclease S subunit|uniref:restriction endonuclease subunit S n=1 Tax=Providencia alcalifaciens TaxID=126385 RepID=UPI002AB5D0C5|nr:restriction endonuclease subunit S [Providencia rettgeri]HEM8141477.1 restriction endonuclease subunit S [Providencia rettgeri]